MQASYKKHFPVMLPEVLNNLAPHDGEVYVDATFGNGGYTEAVLKAANCKVIAIDRDPTVLPRVQELKQIYGNRFDFKQGCFGSICDLISDSVNGFMFDIGVSSMQLDQAERGFSFSKSAPLDMRMSCSGLSAADIVNQTPEKELADLIYKYGEEPFAKKIAANIVKERENAPIETTAELVRIIEKSIPSKVRYSGSHPAKRVFQAIRIEVNGELSGLYEAVLGAIKLLKPGGRIAVITFHSLEDRIVKQAFKYAELDCICPPRSPICTCDKVSEVEIITKKPILPSETEMDENPRSKSAKLRIAEKKEYIKKERIQ